MYRMIKYTVYFIGFLVSRIETAPPQPTGILPSISVYNTTHAIIDFEESFSPSPNKYDGLLTIEGTDGHIFYRNVVDKKAPLDICREHLKMKLEYEGIESSNFEFHPINYTEMILNHICENGDTGLVLIDVEEMIRINSTFAYCHRWIKIHGTEHNNDDREIIVKDKNVMINVTGTDPHFKVQYKQSKKDTEGHELWNFDVEKSSLNSCPDPPNSQASKNSDNIALYAGLGSGAVLVLLITVAGVCGVYRKNAAAGRGEVVEANPEYGEDNYYEDTNVVETNSNYGEEYEGGDNYIRDGNQEYYD